MKLLDRSINQQKSYESSCDALADDPSDISQYWRLQFENK